LRAVALPALLAVITALTALTGYLRESSLAMAFGAGLYTDAYFVAAAIPMVAGDLLVGSVLTASVVPVFAPLIKDGAAQAPEVRRAVTAIFIFVVAISVAVAFLLRLAVPVLVDALSPGFGPEAHEYTLRLARALVWLLPLNAMVLLPSLLLNAARTYVVPASAWLVVNLVFVVTIHVGFPSLGPDVLVWGPLLGPLVMAATLYWRLGRRGLRPVAVPDFRSVPLRQSLRLARPVLLTGGIGSGLGILMVCHLLLRSFGSTFEAGVVSALGYAFRLYEVPVSLVVATAGTLVFTELSRLASNREHERFVAHCRDLLAWGTIVLVPTVLLTAVFADTLVKVLFQRGAFTSEDARLTARALRGFSAAILFESILMVGLRVLYALRRPRSAVVIGAATIAALFLSAALARQSHSVIALAGALSASFAVAAVLVIASISRGLGRSILPPARDVLIACVLAGAAAGVVALARQRVVPTGVAWDGALVAGYGLLYGAGLALLCPTRWAEVKSRTYAALRGVRGKAS
jgi:putative peptidoglycan lipid II flippase